MKEQKTAYESIVEGEKALISLMKFLIPNTITSDIDFLEENIQEGLDLEAGLKDFNVFRDLEAIYFEKGKQDVEKLIERWEKAYSHTIRNFRENYNRGSLKKASREFYLYRSANLKRLIYHTYGELNNTIWEIRRFKEHYLKESSISTTQPNEEVQREVVLTENPIFNSTIIEDFFNVIQPYFDFVDQAQLMRLLKNDDSLPHPLIFKNNGNRLAYAFRELIENDLITGCDKKQLQNWMMKNFQYVSKKKVIPYSFDYLEKCISRNFYPCKRPLFRVENKKIINV